MVGKTTTKQETKRTWSTDVSPEGIEIDARALTAPVRPLMEKVEGQEVSHVPYRPFCSFCVRGRGQSVDQRRVDKRWAIPIKFLDYGFLGIPESSAHELFLNNKTRN